MYQPLRLTCCFCPSGLPSGHSILTLHSYLVGWGVREYRPHLPHLSPSFLYQATSALSDSPRLFTQILMNSWYLNAIFRSFGTLCWQDKVSAAVSLVLWWNMNGRWLSKWTSQPEHSAHAREMLGLQVASVFNSIMPSLLVRFWNSVVTLEKQFGSSSKS